MALLLLAACCGGPAASSALAAGGKPTKGKPPKGAPEKPPEKPTEPLPAGCTRLADGHGAVVSPNGKWIAYMRGGPSVTAYWRTRQEPIELRVRESKSDTFWPLPIAARPVGWVEGTLLLDTGVGVDPSKGVRTGKVASLPADAKATEVAWSRDGKRLAWVPRVAGTEKTAIRVVDTDAKVVPLSGTEGLRTDQAVFLAWSPDASTLYVNGLFQAEKELPVRRVGLVDATTGAMKLLATMPDWIGIPGLQNEEPHYRDPRIERPKLVELGWPPPAEPRYGRQVFSADGRLAVWLAGTGWIEADAFVVDLASSEVKRVTNDGEVKWSPALDATGRRLAFLTADGAAGYEHKFKNPRIRIVDLLTGEPTDVALAVGVGIPAWLSWTPDATAVIYDVRSATAEGTFSQTVSAPKSAPAGAKVLSLEYTARNRVVTWLASYDEDRVHTAVHRAEDAWDPFYLPALRETLQTWKDKKSAVLHCLVHMFDLRKMREVVPDLRAALSTPLEENRVSIFEALLHLGEADAADELERLRTTTKDAMVRYRVGFLLAKAGDVRGWPSIAEATKSDDYFTRREVCRDLATLRDPRSVDLLIPLVADRRMDPRFKLAKLPPVAPLAQLALRALTGQSLGDDPAKWTAWWKNEAKGVLPENVPPPDDPDHDLGG